MTNNSFTRVCLWGMAVLFQMATLLMPVTGSLAQLVSKKKDLYEKTRVKSPHAAMITMQMQQVTVSEALQEISRLTKSGLLVNPQSLPEKRISVSLKNASLEKALSEVLRGSDLEARVNGEGDIIVKKRIANAPAAKITADRQIRGTVTDSVANEVLPGVNILIAGTGIGTTTDSKGVFSLDIPESGPVKLVFSFVGFISKEVTVQESQVSLSMLLSPANESLSEVVVVGYGTQKKVNLTGAVDQISSKNLSALQVNTIGEALQGQIPGVFVDIADGKPGRFASFNIRGNTSINGGSPLIVIDGVPQTGNDLNNISPYDIEDISILKDAASTAIYGARASFGVILVTTKRGKKGKLNVQYNNYFGVSRATRVPEVYDNPVDYISINENEFNGNIGQTYFTDAQVEYPYQVAQDPSLPHAQVQMIGGRSNLLLGGEVHNYYKEWLRKYTPKQNHRLSLSGGDEKFQYYLSGDFNTEEGAIKFKPEKIKRYTLRSNLTYKLNDHISLFNNTTFIKRTEEHPNQYLYGFTSNVYRFIENSHPMMPEYVDIDGKQVPTDIGFYKEFLRDKSGIEEGVHDVKTTLGADVSLLKNTLKFHLDGTYQFGNTNILRWWDNKGPYLSNSFNNRNIVLDAYADAGPPKVYRSMWRTITGNVNAYGSYSKVTGKHDATLLVGYNQESYDYLYSYAEHQNPLDVEQKSLNLATGAFSASDEDSRNASRSMFSRLMYNYDGKYLFEMNGSYFLSSKFAKENRGHVFLAGSAAWRISEEKFFDPIKNAVNNLKVRVSYGSIGNSNIGSYDYIPIMEVVQSPYTLEGTRVNYTRNPLPKSANFTWETVETANFGLDFGFLRNRLNGTLDIYQRNTRNMLANYRSLPSVFGATVPKENIASMRNRGWELNLNWADQFTLAKSEFNYGIRFNLSDYNSVITDYYNPTNYLVDYYKGQQLGEIWGLNTLGYFATDEEAKNGALLNTSGYRAYAAAGTIKFEDVNGDGVISYGSRTLDNPGDYKIIGNTTPRYQYGITLNGGWKGFDLNAFFRGVGKRDIYPGAEAVNFWGPYNRKYQVMLKHTVEERWTPENPDAYFPRPQGYLALASNDLGQNQTKYLQNAAFFRLKSLTLGYTIPERLTRKVKLGGLRMYVTGQNLWEKTKLHFSLDPEGLTKDPDANQGSVGLGTAYPVQRVYAFGFELKF
ncbi:SusC/RagA family TonB-linked outer membrane protein [Dyadobacter aurulentus]|uniref:SusC/RagA family TonB-linked outer membrane protein n=1 Tax=Dyadobacter sp. UC 10 TaxID=2605428 RepID=UPI0011F2E6C6|nr:SusC/RagA family TonB-linked outer membrane protein [Dyadobacter sp. UC 10]KAA0992671.1 SusC/RagA family TonB-linked outer membrane protein [Dyadobacter sp. UC 10]